jgi:hypothetical protein
MARLSSFPIQNETGQTIAFVMLPEGMRGGAKFWVPKADGEFDLSIPGFETTIDDLPDAWHEQLRHYNQLAREFP